MSLDVELVDGRRGLAAFVDVVWRIPELRAAPQWVPPLRIMVRQALDTARTPFYREASRALFIARRNGRPVGRIAAIENRVHNATHDETTGFFGFFDARHDPEAAAALLDAASRWLSARGLTAMRGPMNPSTNYECGMLVGGFDEHPVFGTPWNPAYYAELMHASGMRVVKNLVGYWLPFGEPGFAIPERARALADRAAARSNLTFRTLQRREFAAEMERCWDIYNQAWERNWGFVPMARDEFAHMANHLKNLLLPEFAFIAEVRGEPAGLMLGIPDFNRTLKHNRSGRLFPLGAIRMLRAVSRERTGRVIALGIKRQFRTGAILPLFLHEAIRRAMEQGYRGAEASWVLEDNRLMRHALETWGGRLYRHWSIFERALG